MVPLSQLADALPCTTRLYWIHFIHEEQREELRSAQRLSCTNCPAIPDGDAGPLHAQMDVRTVYVGNLTVAADEVALRSVFETCGEVKQIRMAGCEV